jgi:PAS domain S-box-containing protein
MMNDCSVVEWINSVDTCIFTVDGAGQITSWNQATEALLGYLSDDVVDQPMFPLIGCSHSQFKNIMARKDGSAEHRLRLLTQFDQPVHVLLKTSVQRDPAGAFKGLVCFVEEIKIPAMNGNRESPIALTDHMDFHSTIIFGIDASGCIDVWNDKAAAVTGYSKEDALGRNMLDMVGHSHPDDGVGKLFRNSMTTKGELNFKIELRTKVGEFRRLALMSTARFNHGGQRIGTVFLALDVTEMDSYPRLTEMMLHTKVIEMSQLIEKANIAVFGVDGEGKVNEWNDKMFEISGYDKRAAFGRNFVDAFVVVSLHQSVHEIVDGGLQGEGTSGFELELRTMYGDTRYLLLNASTRRDILGNITGVLFIAEDVTEQAQHDRAIASMARELRQLVDTANAPIFGIDIDGLVNEWNEKTAEITGFSGDEAFNRPFVDTFIVPKLRTSVQDVLDNALKGRGTSNYELEVRTKSSEIRFLLVNATTRRDAENNIVGVVVVAQDVTEAAKHDRAVAAMANELRQLIDNANAPIFGIDIDGDVNEWNDKTAEITGFTKEEAFDCNLVETFIVPSLRDSVQAIMASALEGIGTSNYELEFRTKSNEIRHLLVNATTRRDAENNVVGVVGVAQDVTEAVHRDRAVTSMANELRLLIDTANAPIFGIDNDGNVNEWNNKTAEITGYLKEEAFDQPLVKKFIAPAMRKQVAEIMDKALAGNPTSNYELEIVAKSKEVRVLLVNATTRRDPDNNIVGGKFSAYAFHLDVGTILT